LYINAQKRWVQNLAFSLKKGDFSSNRSLSIGKRAAKLIHP